MVIYSNMEFDARMNCQRPGLVFYIGLLKKARVVKDRLLGRNLLAVVYNADSDYRCLK